MTKSISSEPIIQEVSDEDLCKGMTDDELLFQGATAEDLLRQMEMSEEDLLRMEISEEDIIRQMTVSDKEFSKNTEEAKKAFEEATINVTL